MHLLARHAECLFWLGRYIERTSSLARILLVQTAFDRGRAEGSGWAWILALYDQRADFEKRHSEYSSENVIKYYLTDTEHLGSVFCSLQGARSNARTLRAMISTDFWTHINRVYGRVKNLTDDDIDENRLAATCEKIQFDCYALLGIASSTLYRDAGWRFFEMGLEIERADQMSRLLDVRFAQLKTGTADGGEMLGDFAHWSMLLRACAGHHAYRQLVSGPLQPENVARFLIFEQSFARSIGSSAIQLERSVTELRQICDIPTPGSLLKRISDLHDMLHLAKLDPGLVPHLHHFNDAMQRQLGDLTTELGDCYFEFKPDIEETITDQSGEPEQPEWVQPAADDDAKPVTADAAAASAGRSSPTTKTSAKK